jgi:quercetin dioxygenase-like cupin family protein
MDMMAVSKHWSSHVDTHRCASTKGEEVELPDMITRLPEADLPYPAAAVKTSVLQSAHGQLVFFQIFKDVEIPAHSHKGQWGTVLEGQVELTIGGKTQTYGPGNSYYIPPGVVHSARAPAGAKVIDFFEEPDRYRLK